MEPTKRQMPTQLAIDGKVISIEKIGVLEEGRLTDLYNTLHDMAVKAAEEAQANQEEVQEPEEVKEETKEVEPTNTEE